VKQANAVIEAVKRHYPGVQAVYLFGGHGAGDERPDSDVDLALLLSPEEAGPAGSLAMSDLRFELESLLGREVDLVNLRKVNTVFQHEIIQQGRTIYQQSEYAVDSFEMLVMSLYQKLNAERAEILEEIIRNGRIIGP
jgi:predicted nucleotidyltransferase